MSHYILQIGHVCRMYFILKACLLCFETGFSFKKERKKERKQNKNNNNFHLAFINMLLVQELFLFNLDVTGDSSVATAGETVQRLVLFKI